MFSRDGIRTELEQMCHFYHFIDFVVVKDLQGIWYGSGGSSGLDFIRQWDSENGGERLKAQTGEVHLGDRRWGNLCGTGDL